MTRILIFARRHKIITALLGLFVAFIALGAIVGSPPKKKISGTVAANTNKIAQLAVNKATSDPRWFGLVDCLTASGLTSGANGRSLDSFGVLTASGGVVGNIWYRGRDIDHYGPVSYALQALDGVPQSAVNKAVGCIYETFGREWRQNKYVKKYNSLVEQLDDKASLDPRWRALRGCLRARGFSYFYESDFPTTIMVQKTGVVDYGSGGPGTLVGGRVKYLVDTNPPSSMQDKRAFIGCINREY